MIGDYSHFTASDFGINDVKYVPEEELFWDDDVIFASRMSRIII